MHTETSTEILRGLVEAALPYPDLVVRKAAMVQAGHGDALLKTLREQAELCGGHAVLLRNQIVGGVAGDVLGQAVAQWAAHHA